MIKILPDTSEINQSRGVSMTYRSIIQQQLSLMLRQEVAECLSETKNWITESAIAVDPIGYQCTADKYTKILYVENSGQKVSVHCQCKYSWKATQRWQYGYATGTSIWILKKLVNAGCDYIAIVNRHMNQMLLIPRSELEKSASSYRQILNKMNGKYSTDLVYEVPYYENSNIEYFARQYGSDVSNWTKRNLDGSPIS